MGIARRQRWEMISDDFGKNPRSHGWEFCLHINLTNMD